ncbi:MAG TPA: hypothetical protein VI756_13480 [Blastocatellia bacterium]
MNRRKNHVRACILVGFAALALLFGLKKSRADSPIPQMQAGTSRDRAFFPHGKPEHRKVACLTCHTITPAKIDETVYPGHASCVTCHNFATEALGRPITYCGICHDGRPASKAQPALFPYPKPGKPGDFGMDFSHPAHLKPRPPFPAPSTTSSAAESVSGQLAVGPNPDESGSVLRTVSFTQGDLVKPTCFDCHKQNQQVGRRPVMDYITNIGHPACFTCHGQNPVAPPSMFQCAVCHDLGGPKYQGLLGEVVRFKHSDHVYDTRPIIRGQTVWPRAPDYLCSECHKSAVTAERLDAITLPQQNYCSECHNGRLGLPDPLEPDVLQSLNRQR